jgi:O-phospho-L-seryl-tRNASec:L-selenocysteinyl-tRNA synthase
MIETSMCGDELRTGLTAMEHQVATLGAENIACILTTTRCFGPRASDSVEQVAVLCSPYNVPHIINNEHGLVCILFRKLPGNLILDVSVMQV